MPSKVKYNLKNVHWAVATESGYSTTVNAWEGAVSISWEPQGEDYVFYADGVAYFEYHTNNGYEGELECALIPEAFKTAVLGESLDTNNNLVELDDSAVTKFALGFQIDGDVKDNFYWFYNCTASRPTVAGQTKEENIEVNTETITITSRPDPRITVDDAHPVKVKSGDASTATATTWFASVVLPD